MAKPPLIVWGAFPQAIGTGVDAFRLRVQDFRVLFNETADTITILDIGPRGGIFD